LVIFDEVFTGFGRTGTFFALQQIHSRPDIVCLSKGMTSGMLPLAATVTTEAIYSEFCGNKDRVFNHGHTFSGNGLGCAVALENLRLFDEYDVIAQNKTKTGVFTEAQLRMRSLSCVGDVRRLGMVWAMELVSDQKSRAPMSDDIMWTIAEKAYERGVWLRPLRNVLYVAPPYCASIADLEWVFEVIHDCCRSVCEHS
jgi:adenosylmethionine-8-amino-7-oxononanoate aminotransferase